MNTTEDDFRAWLANVQGIPFESLDEEARGVFRRDFEDGARRFAAWQGQRAPARGARGRDTRYAVAIEDGDELGLSFWIKRSQAGEVFLFYPRDREMDPHASYHADGTYHQKSYGVASMAQQRQPLNGSFVGTEHLGTFGGHGAGPRIVSRDDWDDILVVRSGILTARTGRIAVDLVAPDMPPAAHHRELLRIVDERTYRDAVPWILVAISE